MGRRVIIPDDRLGEVLDAVSRRRAYPLAIELGVSTPALVQAALRAAEDPQVYAGHPRPCRVIRERQQQAREARSARLGGSEV